MWRCMMLKRLSKKRVRKVTGGLAKQAAPPRDAAARNTVKPPVL